MFVTNLNPYLWEASIKATVLASLITVFVLVALFAYLNRYTRRPYFRIWTGAWLFYALWLALSLNPGPTSQLPIIQMFRQWSLGVAALFLVWGSSRFLGKETRQTPILLYIVFLLTWTYTGAFVVGNSFALQVPLFILIGASSLITASSFLNYRLKSPFVGAGLLAVGFALWGAYLIAYPFLQFDQGLITTGFFVSAVMHLLIAVSMIVLVLEEVRAHSEKALILSLCEKDLLTTKVISTEERYRSLFDQASEAIVIASAEDLNILELNQTALQLLGIAEADKKNSTLASFCKINELRGCTPAEVCRWLLQKRQVCIIRTNGQSLACDVDGAPIDFEGRPAYQFFIREVTERAKLEQQLRQAEKLSALGNMISGVAHELNNPLTVIKGYLELVLARPDLSPETRADLQKVSHEGNRAAKLVKNFLTFAREHSAERELASLNEIISEVCDVRKVELIAAETHLILDLDPDLPLTCLDADRFQQVFVNLVTNSLQALTDHDGARKLRIRTTCKDNMAIVKVEDSGPGVPVEHESRIFEPFFTTKEVGTGTGLGLSIAHSILAEHRGRLYYEHSTLGGACFVMEIPIAQAVARVEPKPEVIHAEVAKDVVHSARILILDDEKSIAELLSEMFELLGHHTTICHAPKLALEIIKKQPYDIILSDYRMPVMNGQEFYKQVKKMSPDLAARIIFLTGDLVNEETQSFLNSIGNLHIAKPFQFSKLQEAIESVLFKQRALAQGLLFQLPATK